MINTRSTSQKRQCEW